MYKPQEVFFSDGFKTHLLIARAEPEETPLSNSPIKSSYHEASVKAVETEGVPDTVFQPLFKVERHESEEPPDEVIF